MHMLIGAGLAIACTVLYGYAVVFAGRFCGFNQLPPG